MKFTSIFLLVLLTFGNVVSASVSVCEIFDYSQETEQSIFDEENQDNDAGDCCDHYCSCVKQMNNTTSTVRSLNADKLTQPFRVDTVLSQSSPPLLRPPIA